MSPAPSPSDLAAAARAAGIGDERVLAAISATPRAGSVPGDYLTAAYRDEPIPIGHRQVTTQPSLPARMIQGPHLASGDHVLQIGTGLGFQTAPLARLAAGVISIERWPDLADQARRNPARHGTGNAEVLAGDGSRGLPDRAPYDAILVSAPFPQVPAPRAAQLRIGGRLVQPTGPGGSEQVVLFERSASGLERRHVLTLARFVRLHRRYGFQSRPRPGQDIWPVAPQSPRMLPSDLSQTPPSARGARPARRRRYPCRSSPRCVISPRLEKRAHCRRCGRLGGWPRSSSKARENRYSVACQLSACRGSIPLEGCHRPRPSAAAGVAGRPPGGPVASNLLRRRRVLDCEGGGDDDDEIFPGDDGMRRRGGGGLRRRRDRGRLGCYARHCQARVWYARHRAAREPRSRSPSGGTPERADRVRCRPRECQRCLHRATRRVRAAQAAAPGCARSDRARLVAGRDADRVRRDELPRA
jgi:protein-L-isoaspartate(D-aspartate) O-methyltransferase